MVFLYLIIKPYKENIVNVFSVINESALSIIGFYLFFFLDEDSAQKNLFYAWLMIIIVVAMVAWNLIFILVFKLKDLWK